ncbi:MAG: quinone-dependent dihydroorotate dehydrogenase [Sulfurovum sp.]|nr:quinone-dependent dihydroorotate dehydrogenase [Sulfurovum sp.]MCB4755012.1 quinone-dependent dihydroorotate dehydrogenase [Sulfurovum sp.]MCB4758037.1 quinone-dependent dihydroorotate dehydrogenase [Sulfurovum sp.]MCB4764782.1 quinone-dependent dihydroorotate dehydrogenase [Sulfurovum sp.]MCB4778074.1 quinone-dependent dihydroorotate dehydrogenase [Sulfurovum sp.]
MSLLNYETFKKILFKLDPETAHTFVGFGLQGIQYFPPIMRYFSKKFFVRDPMLAQVFFGRTFCNPVGLGAGFDKNGQYITAISAMGFGFTEIGTVTPKPQEGNSKPRLFRLIKDRSIQNAMGFNNYGMDYMLQRLNKLCFFDYPVGINIGKNRITSEGKALKDYEILFHKFKDHGDYIVINISSPNTPKLRNLQNEQFVKDIFTMAKHITSQPVLLKISPDMTPEDAVALCNTAVEAGAAGIIATNTTTDYSLTSSAKEFGGISGALLAQKSYELFRAIGKELHDKTLLISVGGIDSAEEAYKRIKAGASLVQVYSMFIYQGPALIKEINEGLIALLKEDGYNHIDEAIGSEWR